MEELRSGRLNRPRPRTAGPLDGKRAVVTPGAHGTGRQVAEALLAEGCRVAVFDADEQAGRQLAYAKGVRYCRTDAGDAGSVAEAFRGVLKAWRDVDIAVAVEETTVDGTAEAIARVWEEHKRRFPIPSDYGCRLISVAALPFTPQAELQSPDITVSRIAAPEPGKDDDEEWRRILDGIMKAVRQQKSR